MGVEWLRSLGPLVKTRAFGMTPKKLGPLVLAFGYFQPGLGLG
jgi:hypothetical protein